MKKTLSNELIKQSAEMLKKQRELGEIKELNEQKHSQQKCNESRK